jgi:FixJ family two-component response regulator
VRGFPSTRAFLAQPRDEPPALVVLNLPPPVSSRLQVLRELRVSGFRVPTIVISADQDLHGREECLAVGAAGYLRKPLDDRLLLNAISVALARPAMTR